MIAFANVVEVRESPNDNSPNHISRRKKCRARLSRATHLDLDKSETPRRPNRLRSHQPALGPMKLALLGAGAWGTALAISLARAHDVTLWARNSVLAETLRNTRNNARYLTGYALPKNVEVEDSLTKTIAKAEVIISIVPTAALREVTKLITREKNSAPIIIASKGFETGTGKLPYEVCAETLSPDAMIGVLSGPSFAQEVAKGLPAALTLAAFNETFATETARELNGPRLRVYSSNDVIGVALGGGLKTSWPSPQAFPTAWAWAPMPAQRSSPVA